MPLAGSVQSIHSGVKAIFQSCCAIPLKRISVNAYDETLWKLLFLIPRIVLSHLARGGKKKGGNIKETYRRFFAYQWEELLCNIDFPVSHQEHQPSKETTSGVEKAALRLVKCGEIARTAKVLMSSGLAPASEETAKKASSQTSCKKC